MEIDYTLDEIDHVAKQLIAKAKTKTLLFYGTMGMGKTTLIKALVKHLGSSDVASSPTFSIVNEYNLESTKIFHFDLYRVKNLEEAYNFGIEDYLDSEAWKFVEWPELIEPILYDDSDKIYIETDEHNKRKLKLVPKI